MIEVKLNDLIRNEEFQPTAGRHAGVKTPRMTLGPFIVDSRGMLSPSSKNTFPAFYVLWRKLVVRARLVQQSYTDGDNSADLEFTARLGRIPSSAGVPALASLRVGALQVLRRMPALTPPGWRLLLRADHSVEVTTKAEIVLPVSAISLVTEVTVFLLGLTPYLTVLEEEGVTSTAFGKEKI